MPSAFALAELRSRTYYTDVALKTLESKAPRLGEQLMRPPPGYELQSQWLRAKLAEGEARLLTRQLGRRFGELDEATRTKIASASMSELETWGERLLFAATLEDVFRDPS